MASRVAWWRERPGLSRLGIAAVAVGVAVAGAVAGAALSRWVAPAPGSCDSRAVAAAALPAVVTVFASGASGSGSGSGAIIEADGTIVTNDHVIAAGVDGTLEVLLNNGERLPATLIGTDPLTDLAVLRIDHSGLPVLTVAAEEVLSVGQPVVALGAPLGLSNTVTSGIVSALDRSVPVPKAGGGTTVLIGAVQTDAAINPGNSGGPLVTCEGRLVGVNTAISTVPNSEGVAGGGSVGIGFAVPATTVERIVGELTADGHASHPWAGMSTAEVTPQAAAEFGTPAGLFVQSVDAGGPAEAAGLRAGDLITSLAGSTATSRALSWQLLTAPVGAELKLTYLRGGTSTDTTLVLAEQP